jgi:hypothetical protein
VFADRALPDLLIPDAELVDIARNHDVARDSRIVAKQRQEQDPPLRIECQLVCARDVDVAEEDVPGIEAVLGEEAALETPPRRERVDVEAAMRADLNLVATRRSSWSRKSSSRNWNGRATRPLSSTACSKWPLNISPTAVITAPPDVSQMDGAHPRLRAWILPWRPRRQGFLPCGRGKARVCRLRRACLTARSARRFRSRGPRAAMEPPSLSCLAARRDFPRSLSRRIEKHCRTELRKGPRRQSSTNIVPVARSSGHNAPGCETAHQATELRVSSPPTAGTTRSPC